MKVLTIQWFPGHMAKARREVTEKLKLIDVVIELLDARIPLSSRNPMIDEIIKHKPRLVVLNKSDLADEELTEKWKRYFEGNNVEVVIVDSQSGKGVSKIYEACQKLARPFIEKMKAKGIKPRAIRALIVGIPNVGKSTLINRLAAKKIAKTGDRPGITKSQQWIKVGKQLELLDTPGILWPKFEDKEVGLRLAATGAIKDEILDLEEVVLFVIDYLKTYYPERLKKRFNLEDLNAKSGEIVEEIGKKRGCLLSGGQIDYEKTYEIILREVRSGKVGKITFERLKEE